MESKSVKFEHLLLGLRLKHNFQAKLGGLGSL